MYLSRSTCVSECLLYFSRRWLQVHTRLQPLYSTVHEDPPIPLPPCQISYYRFSLLVSKRCFFSSSLPLSLPRKSMYNQDDGFTLPGRRFCCICSLSTAIYTWETDKFGVWISLLHTLCDVCYESSLPRPAFTQRLSPCKVAWTFAYAAIATILHPQ